MIAPIIYAAADDEVDTATGTQTAKPLNLVRSYPEDNDSRLQVDNTGIKLFFDGNVIDESVWKNNRNLFKLSTAKGKEVNITAYSSAESGTDYILVVVQQGQTLDPNSKYTFTIMKGMQSKEGQILAEDVVLNFTTVDMQGNMRVNMGLMGLMAVGMIAMTVVSNKRQAKKDEENSNKKDAKVNPYKVAKQKGKSVQEVVDKVEKDKARKAKRLKGNAPDDDDDDDDYDDDVYIYHKDALRKVADGGSTYKTGRKAEAEKRAKREAARKKHGNTNQKKNKKKGKKKR